MISYTVIRSDRKTLALEVNREGEVIARAPKRMPDKVIETFVDEKQRWILKRLAERLDTPGDDTPEDVLRLRAKEILPGRVRHFSERLGVFPRGITVTGALTRYGSCSAKGRICFSCFLMRSPPDAVDYVVVHELCHLRHMNHGAAFYQMVASVMPDWREKKKGLLPL